MIRLLLSLTLAALPLACVASEPEPPPPPPPQPRTVTTLPSFDRSWDAALGAAGDVDVQIRSADKAAGRIVGDKAGVAVTIDVLRQADGSVKIAFNAPGSPETNPKLGDRWLSAYQRRMGR